MDSRAALEKDSNLPRCASTSRSKCRPSIIPIFVRSLALLLSLFFATAVAASVFARGFSWLYDTTLEYSPLLSCPSAYLSSQTLGLDGPSCKINVKYNKPFGQEIIKRKMEVSGRNPRMKCRIPFTTKGQIECYNNFSCAQSCSLMYQTGVDSDQNPLWASVGPGSCPRSDRLLEVTTIKDKPMCAVQMFGGYHPAKTPADYFTFGTLKDPLQCAHVDLETFCDSEYRVTPSNAIAIRGLLSACVVIVLIWHVAEWIMWRAEWKRREERARGDREMESVMPHLRKAQQGEVRQRWKAELQRSSQMGGALSTLCLEESQVGGRLSSPLPSSISLSSKARSRRRPPLASRDPQKRFESMSWARMLRQYFEIGHARRHAPTRVVVQTLISALLYFLLMVGSLYLVILATPQQVRHRTSIFDSLTGSSSVWDIASCLDIIIFGDVLLDLLLTIIAACLVKWPAKAVFATHLQERIDDVITREVKDCSLSDGGKVVSFQERGRGKGRSGEDVEEIDAASAPSRSDMSEEGSLGSSRDSDTVSFVMRQTQMESMCVLIACKNSNDSEIKTEKFKEMLRATLMVFPPAHIFVCDRGSSLQPTDRTEWVARSVHPDLNYLYVPEDNKMFSFFWCNKFWIPMLEQAGRVPPFRFAFLMDDGVMLPKDLYIPHEILKKNSDIKAVHFPVTPLRRTKAGGRGWTKEGEVAKDRQGGMLNALQGVDFKMSALHKMFQATVATALCCESELSLWSRESLDLVFYEHDSVEEGAAFFMGHALLRLRNTDRIVSCGQSVIPVPAPSSFLELFEKRVKGVELTSHRKMFTLVHELLAPSSLEHLPSCFLKPYFFLEVCTVVLDWLRVFVLVGLLLRDWLGLIIVMGGFVLAVAVQVGVFEVVVLRVRPDLRASLSVLISYPFFRLSHLLFRLCALCENLLKHAFELPPPTLGVREDEVRDIPPTPPHPDVSWSEVWMLRGGIEEGDREEESEEEGKEANVTDG